jgi:hypothetical protein
MTTAAQQKRARERHGTRSGSSGVTGLVAQMERHDYDDLKDDLVHGADLAGKVSDLRVYANGSVGLVITVPAEYAHEAMDVVQDSRHMFTFMRVYHVPRPMLLPPDGDDDGDE